MPREFRIKSKMRVDLKIPLGELVREKDVSRETLKQFFESARDLITVTVGDRTTERMHEFGLSPLLEIIDSVEKRSRRIPPLNSENDRLIFKTVNNAGSINSDALSLLSLCLDRIEQGSKLRLEVEGEEDLLALPIIAFYPVTTVTFYGQPNEGMVIVRSSDDRARKRALAICREIGIQELPANNYAETGKDT